MTGGSPPIGFSTVHFTGVVENVEFGATPDGSDDCCVFGVRYRNRFNVEVARRFVAYGGLFGLLRRERSLEGSRVTVKGEFAGDEGSPVRVQELVFDRR